jgi:SAM-dependent MidA family methyltransferase
MSDDVGRVAGPSLRRVPSPDPAAAGEQPELVARIRAEIERDGPITFARFMELALYDPDFGYYRSDEPRPGRGGDFLTAPETDPIFGHALARQVDDAWRRLGEPTAFDLIEYGAGTGTLAEAILRGLVADGSGLIERMRYRPVEVDQRRLDQLRRRLDAAGFGALVRTDAPDEPATGIVLANELLDALPVHRVVGEDGELREVFVGVAGDGFCDVVGPPSTPALAQRLADEGVVLAEGQRAEINLGIGPWLDEVAAGLARGIVVVIDYGHPAAELYGPDRRDGTLRAYVRQAVHDDPYRHVGLQDLTAHVDFTAVERAAAGRGFDVLGLTTQAELLTSLDAGGLLHRLGTDPATSPADYLAARAGLARMLDPRFMGGFRVLVLARGVPPDPPLRGLTFRLPPRQASPLLP